ncbi:MAG: cohesin domain-containing protein [Chloroflexota bacterium]
MIHNKTWLPIVAALLIILWWSVDQTEASTSLTDTPQQDNTMTIASITTVPNTSGTLPILLDSQDAIASIQIEFSYDIKNGVTITNAQTTSRTSNRTVVFNQTAGEGTIMNVTILLYDGTSTGPTLAAGSGAILELAYTTSESANGVTDIPVTSALFSDGNFGSVAVTPVDGAIIVENDSTLWITPSRGSQDQAMVIEIIGRNVDWLTNAPTSISIGAGIAVLSSTVVDSTTISATISIDANATAGPRTVTVTAGGEDATKVDGFTVQGPGIGVVMPTDLEGYAGGTVTVPISITSDVTGEDILAYAFNLTHDPIIRLDATNLVGTMSDGWSVTFDRVSAGESRIVAFRATAMAGDGVLLYLTFEISQGAVVGEETEIAFHDFRFNEGEPIAQTSDGHLTIIQHPAGISGCITPVHDFSQVVAGLPISFTNMLSSAQDTVVTTGDDGCYSASVEPGDYTATPSQAGDIGNSINVWDSIQAAFHDLLGEDSNFSEHQVDVCDVSGDGTCTAFDASLISIYRANPERDRPELAGSNVGLFVSNPLTRTHASLRGGDSLTDQDYELYLSGDPTLSWPASLQEQAVRAASLTEAIVVALPSATTLPNSRMSMSVTVENVGQQSLFGYEVFIDYDSTLLTIEGITNTNSVARNAGIGWEFQTGISDGEARVVSYGTTALPSDGVLFGLDIRVKDDVEGLAALDVSHLMFNNGQPVTESVDGQVLVAPIASQIYLPVVAR